MPFEAFGKLRMGTFFKCHDRLWVKVSVCNSRDLKFNAYTVDRTEKDVDVQLIDEARLVNINSGVSSEAQAHIISLFDELWEGKKAAIP